MLHLNQMFVSIDLRDDTSKFQAILAPHRQPACPIRLCAFVSFHMNYKSNDLFRSVDS